MASILLSLRAEKGNFSDRETSYTASCSDKALTNLNASTQAAPNLRCLTLAAGSEPWYMKIVW